jgi:hypothetical protein
LVDLWSLNGKKHNYPIAFLSANLDSGFKVSNMEDWEEELVELGWELIKEPISKDDTDVFKYGTLSGDCENCEFSVHRNGREWECTRTTPRCPQRREVVFAYKMVFQPYIGREIILLSLIQAGTTTKIGERVYRVIDPPRKFSAVYILFYSSDALKRDPHICLLPVEGFTYPICSGNLDLSKTDSYKKVPELPKTVRKWISIPDYINRDKIDEYATASLNRIQPCEPVKDEEIDIF